MQRSISKYFISGLLTLLPIFITLWLFWVVFSFIDALLGGIIEYMFGFYLPGMGIIIGILLAFLIGYLNKNVFGKALVQLSEKILYKLPLVNFVYSSVKQLNNMFFQQRETRTFRRVCAIEWPRKGLFAIGFVTGEGIKELASHNNKKMINVFIPNTPSPATGFFTCLPEDEVVMLDMRIEDAIKLIVSGGALTPLASA